MHKVTTLDSPQQPQPLAYTPVPHSGGGKLTNTEARRLVSEIRNWAEQFNHDDAKKLVAAMNDMDRLFIRVWTEIDESLMRLSFIGTLPDERAEEHRQIARKYLNRWQDRGGHCGNAGVPAKGRGVQHG